MKFLPLLAFVSAPAFAQDDTTQKCAMVGDLASKAQEAYTVGVPMSEMIEIADGDQLLVAIIMDAYDEPRYSAPEVVASANFEFRNKWEHDCFQALNNQ